MCVGVIAGRDGMGASSWIVGGVRFGFGGGLGFIFGLRLQIVEMGSFMESVQVARINGMCE